MAMWILSKFAILFFLMGLTAAILIFKVNETKYNCQRQTDSLARDLGGRILQVINSPMDDERRLYAIETVLSTSAQGERYTMAIMDLNNPVDSRAKTLGSKIRINVYPGASQDCDAAYTIDYTAEFSGTEGDVHFSGKAGVSYSREMPDSKYWGLNINPTERDYAKRPRGLVIIKCTERRLPARKHLWIIPCYEEDKTKCTDLTAVNPETCEVASE